METLKRGLWLALGGVCFGVAYALAQTPQDSLIADQIGQIGANVSGIVAVGLGIAGNFVAGLLIKLGEKISELPDSLKVIISMVAVAISQVALGLLGQLGFPFLSAIPSNILDFDQGSVTLILAWAVNQGTFRLYKLAKPSA